MVERPDLQGKDPSQEVQRKARQLGLSPLHRVYPGNWQESNFFKVVDAKGKPVWKGQADNNVQALERAIRAIENPKEEVLKKNPEPKGPFHPSTFDVTSDYEDYPNFVSRLIGSLASLALGKKYTAKVFREYKESQNHSPGSKGNYQVILTGRFRNKNDAFVIAQRRFTDLVAAQEEERGIKQ